MHPTHDPRHGGLGAHVTDGVTHAEVCAHGAVEHAVKDAEYVGGCAADIDANCVDSPLARDGLQDVTNGTGRWHDGRVGP